MYACLSVFAAVARANGMQEEGLLFYAGFDGKMEIAGHSADGKKGEVLGEISTTEGIKGKAVVVGGKGSVVFEGEKNINIHRGTLSFWFSPQDWEGTDPGTVIFIRMTVKNDNAAWFSRYDDRQTWGNALSVNIYGPGEDGKPAWSGVRGRYGSAAHLKKKQWHHFLVTWDESTMHIYMNAELQGYGGKRLFRQPDSISIGPGRISDTQPQSAIDEVKIFDRYFDLEDVRELFAQEIPHSLDDHIF